MTDAGSGPRAVGCLGRVVGARAHEPEATDAVQGDQAFVAVEGGSDRAAGDVAAFSHASLRSDNYLVNGQLVGMADRQPAAAHLRVLGFRFYPDVVTAVADGSNPRRC